MADLKHAFDIFDIHHHVGRAMDSLGMIAGPRGNPNVEDAVEYDLQVRLALMDRAGVRQALLMPGPSYTRANGAADTRLINDEIAAYRDRRPDRFPVAFGIVEPRDGEAALAEVDRIATKLGLRGVSFHNRFQGLAVNSPAMIKVLARMRERSLIPVLHAVNECSEEKLWKVASVARQFPDVTFIALSGFATFESVLECSHVAEVAPNIVFDFVGVYTFDFLEGFIARFGASRLLFGTDTYSPPSPLTRRVTHLLGELLESALSSEDKAAILGGNARRVLGL
jgi:predicted TIM-barrel fold metal-dependent hydrolase